MKYKSKPFARTGICAACGKPTKLMVHQECGKKFSLARRSAKKWTDVEINKFLKAIGE